MAELVKLQAEQLFDWSGRILDLVDGTNEMNGVLCHLCAHIG